MPPAPAPVVNPHADVEQECPVCLEPLSFSFRLPGEKPHVIPECGHALHEACFTAVYGPMPGQGRQGASAPRKTNLGVCGVCRRPMKVGEAAESKNNKIAALTGMGERNAPALYPGREQNNGSMTTRTNRSQRSPAPYDPNEDDPLEHQTAGSVRSGTHSAHSNGADQHAVIVAPSIQVRAEFPTLQRTTDATQPLTCIVVVELPARRQPTATAPDNFRSPSVMRNNHNHQHGHGNGNGNGAISPRNGAGSGAASPVPRALRHEPSASELSDLHGKAHSPRPPSPGQESMVSVSQQSVFNPTPTPNAAFAAITEDLRNRIIDWKGHALTGPNGLGPLQLFDILSLRRETQVREFYVYLFREAIICVLEERRKTLGRLLSSSGPGSAFGDGSSTHSGSTSKGVLRLKGRIYIRHIRRVTDTSVANELSLTIDMEDERLDSFILIFKDRSSLETWRATINQLVQQFQQQQGSRQVAIDMDDFGAQSPTSSRAASVATQYAPVPQQHQQHHQQQAFPYPANSKAARMLSGSSNDSTPDSLMGSARSMSLSSATSAGMHGAFHGGMGGAIPEESALEMEHAPVPAAGNPSNALGPLPHAPLDLILVISLPPAHVRASAELKLRVVRSSLDFVIANLDRRDRLSIVTFEVGVGAMGRVRKTPFLSIGRPQGRARLTRFVDTMGAPMHEDGLSDEDDFVVRNGKEEKTDVVTAVNHGLDVVLQRKARNPISGMILVSDAADSTRRAQMDLVLARAEAANIPIHSFGYGRSHDPASLWLMSNHTNGTYTFVKDWYDLRDCLAGCIGGMMSIGVTNMKLHMKIVDGHRFRIRKVSGAPNAILASDGRDVDVELGELRFGERKEMLVELELDNREQPMMRNGGGGGQRGMSATDEFNARMGLDGLSIGDIGNLVDGMMDGMIDEVPVFEVDGGFFDPAAAKNVTRLAHPVLLTVTLLPAAPGAGKNSNGSDPVIVRRRMELLASDMITRALVLVSKKNYPQAQRIIAETKRILHTVLQSITQTLPPPTSTGGAARSRRELLALSAVRTLQSIMQDIQVLSEALEENLEMFAHDQRNFGAQQAMILRDQKAWTGRTATEKLFWTTDNSIELVARSTDWVSRD
ncbi:hypothetical protein AURDEDRAFT_117524 [Auricularia subglabra TFB-10046 SS5]|uniref:RING-type domain-containing protein n=1 Tax=Auricularia subglabra (strain TFB-10046 / SS5) TaxID=717982 RepID=J0WS60_AURST|nr:hypothetical protein AURDEDRAFT_117524 [Auricularia subglabra TFB-10046 SS5]